MIVRRLIVAAGAALLLSGAAPAAAERFGLIGKMNAKAGDRDALIAILIEGTRAMPGCLSYVIAADQGDENGIWITEVWDSKASHDASLALPAVQATIAKARPLIGSIGEGVVTVPAGGVGLPAAPAAAK